ncbi:MAG: hypothetical protein KDB03_23725, partial [Planctomycetales bacterium]|nr:hypothetical protein [Planctomycetales bacterium]
MADTSLALLFRSSLDIRIGLIAVALVWPAPLNGRAQDNYEFTWKSFPTGTTASLRGLAVASGNSSSQSSLDELVLWACGSQGTVVRSLDGGRHWQDVSVAAFAELEFRSLHAFSEREVVVASAGYPAVIMRTMDGGKSWQMAHQVADKRAFFDALRFADSQQGLVVGD